MTSAPENKALVVRADTAAPPPQYQSRPPIAKEERTSRTQLLIFFILSLVTLTHAFDATCICVTLPTISAELDATVSQSLGLGTSFLLSTTIAQPIYSELSHVIGRKPGYLFSLLIFIGGTIICGLARSSSLLLLGRTVQGLGAAGPQALSAMILTDLFTVRRRALFLSLLNIPWAVGTVSGPIIGGLFTEKENIGWRWIFWINLPLLSASFTGAWLLLGYDKPTGRMHYLRVRVDWTGMVLFAFSGVAVLLPLSWGGSQYPWNSPQVITPMILSVIGFVLLALYERMYAANPMFRPSLFQNRSTVLHFVNVTLHGVLMWMVLYYMSIFYLGVKDFSPMMTGVWALPATLTVAPLAAIAGLVVFRTGDYRFFLHVGWVIMTVSLGVMVLIDEHMSRVGLVLITMILGIGIGVLIPSMTFGVQATTSNEDAGHAVAMVYLLRSAGQCLGVAIGLAVFSSRLQQELRKLGKDEGTAQGTIKTMRHSLRIGGPEDTAVLEAVVAALRAVWVTGCAMAFVAGILTLAIKCPRLPKDEEETQPGTQASGSTTRSDGAVYQLQELNAGRCWHET
ncbi:major facilitator superfamily domain-containing protein [Mariannaea sp. PMI_226]|nr:major facilitator superfamily domain-containing protein [Mariannaea sp. PMI_226]